MSSTGHSSYCSGSILTGAASGRALFAAVGGLSATDGDGKRAVPAEGPGELRRFCGEVVYVFCGWADEVALGGCATDDAEAALWLDKDDGADADADEEPDAVLDTGADTVTDAVAEGAVTGAPGAGRPPCVRCALLVAAAAAAAAWSTPCSMPGSIGIGPGIGGISRGVDCFD